MGKPRHKSPDILSDLIDLLAGVQPVDRTVKPASDESRTVPFDDPLRKPKAPEERYPLKLTELQRQALLAARELDRSIKTRIRQAQAGDKPVMLTEEELEDVVDAAYHAMADTTAAGKRILDAIVDKIDDLQIDIEIKAVEEKRRKLPRSSKIFQFKVTLKGVKPPIWRRFQIPDCTLGELHSVLQTVMGWTDSHLHGFVVKGRFFGNPHQNDLGFDTDLDDEDTILISQIPSQNGKLKLLYQYDFGDSWEHDVVLEKVLDPEEGVKYPRCLKGARACPPEDCGGVWGYAEFLEEMSNPQSEEDESSAEWYLENADPEEFSVEEINDLLRRS